MKRIIILSLSLFAFVACNYQESSKKQIADGILKEVILHYDFDNPDTVYFLPGHLNEISGISFYQDSKIACIQDEHAMIYIFSMKEEQITSIIDFGKSDDYEDIAVVEDDVYVLRSDGTLIMIKNFEANQREVIKIDTRLKARNNTEGLYFDEKSNSLLIACKESPSINKEELYDGFKAIYKFDLESNMLIEKPVYLLDLSVIDSVKTTGTVEKFFIEIARKLNLTANGGHFYPSGIAIHPFDTGDIYIISSIGKLLIILNRQGLIKDIVELDQAIFNQPEGICFSDNGDLFISNESGAGNANILKFSYH